MRRLLSLLLMATWAVLAVPASSFAEAPASTASLGHDISIKMRNVEGQSVIRAALTDSAYWNDADKREYDERTYDLIRLKSVESGYVPMITGQGSRDFNPDIVSEIVFHHQNRLPKEMDGAKVVLNLGAGYDEKIGAPYQDAYFYLDLTWLYAVYPQRMYKKQIGDKTVLWFEKLDETFVDAATWAAYTKKIEEANASVDRRWTFNSVEEVESIYGMFVVTEGEEFQTRITFVSKLTFGQDNGFIARVGSKMPGVIRSGLKSGFEASVRIAAWKQRLSEGNSG